MILIHDRTNVPGARDDRGNPYVLYIGPKKDFNDRVERAKAFEMYVRASGAVTRDMVRMRFTAYDADGRHITNKVMR